MDAIAGMLDGPRARQAFLLCSRMDAPWAMRIEDRAPLTVMAVAKGEALVIPDGEHSVEIVSEGDVAIFRGPESYSLADAVTTPVQAVIEPGQICRAPDGSPLIEMRELGVRTWGNSPDGEAVLITGTYNLEGEVSRRLLRTLPQVIILRRDEWDCPVIPLLMDEMTKDEPGQEAVLNRLLDLLLIATLRAWFTRDENETPGWYRAYEDPVVGQVLRLIHHEPASPWTVASLARETGVSRAALARRFNELVGEPPMTFLTGWRIALASDLLLEPDATVGSVADQVGYGSPYALSSAFKRVRGVSPKQYRASMADQASA